MTEQSKLDYIREDRNRIGAQLADMENLANALDVVLWDMQQAPDMPEHLHRHRDALIGISDAMQRVGLDNK